MVDCNNPDRQFVCPIAQSKKSDYNRGLFQNKAPYLPGFIRNGNWAFHCKQEQLNNFFFTGYSSMVRAFFEEKKLLEAFGDEYMQYRRKTIL